MPAPTEKAILALVRQAPVERLVELYRFEVNTPINRCEEVQTQRWLGLSIHGELFRRGVDPLILVDTTGIR